MPDFTHTNEFIELAQSFLYAGPLVAILYNDQSANLGQDTYTESTDVAGNVITISGHNFGNAGEMSEVQFSAAGTLDSALSASTTYYLKNIDGNSFNIASSIANWRSDTFITLNDDGSGTTTITEQAISRLSAEEYVTKKEVPNTNSYTRQSLTLTGTYDTGADNRAEFADSSVDFSASGGSIIFTGCALFRAGSTTYGAVTGDLIGFTTFASVTTINDGSTQPIPTNLNILNTAFSTQGS